MKNFVLKFARWLIRILDAISFSRGTIPVLMYHRVADDDEPLTISTDNFFSQMRFLAEGGHEAITLVELEEILLGQRSGPKKPVVLTFDDGYKDNLTGAKPIMDEFGFVGNVFIITSTIGGKRAFSYGSTEGYPMLSRGDIQELERGGWNIANHTHNHKKLTELTEEEIHSEVQRAKEILTNIIENKETLSYFAAPKDCGGEREIQVLEEAGITMAFAGKGIVHKKMHPRHLVRTEIPNTASRNDFFVPLSSWYYRLIPIYFLLKRPSEVFRQKSNHTL